MVQSGMADDAEIRRENFRAYWGDNFSPSAAASRLWGTASQWSDLYHGRKSFGEKLARQIEDKLGLVRLSLDDPDGPTRAPLSADVLARLSEAPEVERQRLENMLRAHFGLPVLSQMESSAKFRQQVVSALPTGKPKALQFPPLPDQGPKQRPEKAPRRTSARSADKPTPGAKVARK